MTGDTDATPRVELCVRSLCPGAVNDQQERVIERLDRLAAAGAITGYDVVVWGARVAFDSASARTDAGERALERYERFRRWAVENDRSIRPGFELRSVDVRTTGESYTAVVFPALALAEYVDGEVEHVAPCTEGDRRHTLRDRLDDLAATAERSRPSAVGTPPVAGER